jgi:hypothetical protein
VNLSVAGAPKSKNHRDPALELNGVSPVPLIPLGKPSLKQDTKRGVTRPKFMRVPISGSDFLKEAVGSVENLNGLKGSPKFSKYVELSCLRLVCYCR